MSVAATSGQVGAAVRPATRDGAEPRGVVRVQVHRGSLPGSPRDRAVHVAHGRHRGRPRQHRDVDRQTEVVEPVRQARAAGRAAVEPAPQRAGETGVVHGAVPAGAGEVRGGVVPVLGEQPAAVVNLVDGAAQCLRHDVREVVGSHAARHVGHVNAPAVEALAQPVGGHRVGAGIEATRQLGRGVVQLGQARYVEPGGVARGVVVGEAVERTLRRRRVGERAEEPVVVLTRVVGGEVPDQPQPLGMDGPDQPLHRLVAAQERVDPVEGGGVVAVGGPGLEDRRQVEQGRAQQVEVVEVLDDAVEGAAVPLEGDVRPLVDDRLVPLAGDGPVRHRRGHLGAAETVREHLVANLVGHPDG